MEVADNEKAFDVKAAQSEKKTHRLGLLGMKERAEMVGARFSVASMTGKGTTVSVRLALDKACPTHDSPSTT
ncbi:hypothetical protein DDZ13_15145 [Coraliomargarita sinensis]|uniref:Histidine kinase/HSP90-like ATPase domain-containing protein n=1 Tax=Coraliomargarita sinensis TaxID=2174842 RepID=A0A317ZHH8_9BACT|nr:hypothetical protein DDZ13_15145 [Coraliomargarita sinensis]